MVAVPSLRPPTLAMTEPILRVAPRRAALTFIFVTVVLDMLAAGMVLPVLPRLVAGFVGGDTGRAVEFFGLFGTVWALMQFVFSPVLGALSDRYGRRPVVLLSNFGMGVDYILMAMAPSLGWLFVGRTISGVTSASIASANAYISDVTPPEKRSAGFGLLGAAFGLGFVLGPALGGLLGAQDPRLPFWVAAGLSFANSVYGLFVLPESLPPERRARVSWRRAHPMGSLSWLRSHPGLLGLTMANFLGNLAHEALPSTFVLYTGYRYGWGEHAVGLTMAGIGVCSAAVQMGLVRPLVARFGERRVLLAGLSCGAIGFAIYGLAPTGALFYTGLPVVALWGLSGPAVLGILTRRINGSEHGRLQGALSSLRGIAGLLGPGLFSLTFASAIDAGRDWQLPGAPFLLAAFLMVSAMLLAWRVTRPVRVVEARATAS